MINIYIDTIATISLKKPQLIDFKIQEMGLI